MQKKLLQVVLIGICLAFMMGVSFMLGSYYAIHNAEIYVTEWKEGENGDFVVNIELDGNLFQHEVYIY